MSENVKVITDAEIVDEPTTEIVVNWKALGKKVAIYGGVLLSGLAVGYILAQPADKIVDEPTETPEDTTPDES